MHERSFLHENANVANVSIVLAIKILITILLHHYIVAEEMPKVKANLE